MDALLTKIASVHARINNRERGRSHQVYVKASTL